jgi:hypothetical protein
VDRFVVAGIVALAGVALVIWWLGALSADLGRLGDLGLVTVLPTWAYGAFLPLAGAFAMLLERPSFPTWLAVLLVLALIVMLYAVSPWLSGVPRFSPSWRHLGVIDYIVRNGGVNPALDAYHNWPGFFAVVASLAAAVGLPDLTSAALWAPLLFNLLYLPALYVLLDGLTDDRRAVWLGIWVFYLGNWIGQDYFAPQALGLFFYLAVAALLVRWLAARDAPPEGPAPTTLAGRVRRVGSRVLSRKPMRAEELSPGRRAGLAGVLVLGFGFIVTAHQLTPFFIAASTFALFVLLRVRWVTLPALMGLLVAGWVSFMAVAFLIGHFQNVAGYVGTLAESLAANLTGRLSGSPDHRVVVYARLGFTGLVWLLAAAGVLRRLRAGHWDVTTVALAAAPFPLFAVQAYGGEMLLRIAVFALPFTALLAAFAFLPSRQERLGPIAIGTIAFAGVILMGGFMLTRYGNERLETFTRDEVAAVQALYAVAPPGSLLAGFSGNLPWKATLYDAYRYRPIGDDAYYGRLDALLADFEAHPSDAFLIVTRSQEAFAEMILGATPAEWDAFRRTIFATGQFQVILENPDAVVARYVPTAAAP